MFGGSDIHPGEQAGNKGHSANRRRVSAGGEAAGGYVDNAGARTANLDAA